MRAGIYLRGAAHLIQQKHRLITELWVKRPRVSGHSAGIATQAQAVGSLNNLLKISALSSLESLQGCAMVALYSLKGSAAVKSAVQRPDHSGRL